MDAGRMGVLLWLKRARGDRKGDRSVWISVIRERHKANETRLWPTRVEAVRECERVFRLLTGTDAPLANFYEVMEPDVKEAYFRLAGSKTDEWDAYVAHFEVRKLLPGTPVSVRPIL